jgi:hypothetical protein
VLNLLADWWRALKNASSAFAPVENDLMPEEIAGPAPWFYKGNEPYASFDKYLLIYIVK